MAHAEVCPICHGKGTIPNNGDTSSRTKTCHGCNGRGWVEVNETNPVYPLPPRYTPDYDPYWYLRNRDY